MGPASAAAQTGPNDVIAAFRVPNSPQKHLYRLEKIACERCPDFPTPLERSSTVGSSPHPLDDDRTSLHQLESLTKTGDLGFDSIRRTQVQQHHVIFAVFDAAIQQ